MQIEFHFQEGFTGQTVLIEVGEKVAAEFDATTKLMLGMAEIVPLELEPGDEVTIRVSDSEPNPLTVVVDDKTPFVTITRAKELLVAEQTGRRPGYV